MGRISGGIRNNVIPDQVEMKLTLRYHNESLRPQIIEGIRRLCNGLAAAAGLPPEKYPELKYYDQNLPGVYNNPELTARLAGYFKEALGPDRVIALPATMGGEDFGRFGTTNEAIPITIYSLGSVSSSRFAAFKRGEAALPSLHSSQFAPDPSPTLETGMVSMMVAILGLLSEN